MSTSNSTRAVPTDGDYDRFQPNVMVWDDIDAFLSASSWGEGAHIVMLPSGVHIDLLIGGDLTTIGPDRCLPVVFSGAVSNRHGNRGPFYSGLGLAKSVDSPFVAISDATLNTNLQLKLGWYAGRANDGIQRETLRLLSGLAERYRRELLLVGGSGGGFASLYFGARLRVPVSVMVWNPQTDFLNYLPSVVSEYLMTALDLTEEQVSAMSDTERARALAAGDIEHQVLPAVPKSDGSRRMLYLQNAGDGHVVQHTAPYLSQASFEHRGGGRWTNGGGSLLLISAFSEGHNPPPRDAMVQAMRQLLDVNTMPGAVVDGLQARNLIPSTGLETLPRDLRAEAASLQEKLALEATIDARARVEARVVWSGAPNRLGGVSTSFQFNGTAEPFTRAHRDNAVLVPEPPFRPTSVAATIRDGFMNELFTLVSPVLPKPQQLGVFLFGSCVSRDTYEFLDPASFSLRGYVARQSLISAFSEPLRPPLQTNFLPSAFQRRMLKADADSALAELLTEAADETDLLIWDLVDERLGVFDHGGNVWTTDSVELRSWGDRSGHRARARHVAFGSPEHFAAFRAALIPWRSLLDEIGLLDRTVLLAPPWAQSTEKENPAPVSFGQSASQANRLTEPYIVAAQQVVGVPVIGRSGLDPVALTSHQWGAAPFHYDDATYLSLAGDLATAAAKIAAPFGWADADPQLRRRVPTREQRDPRLRAPAPEVQIRQSGPSEITVRVVARDMQSCAFQLHRGPQRVESTPYRRETSHRFTVPLPGIYRCRAFVMTQDGGRVPAVSAPLRIM